MEACRGCGEELNRLFRFCPWCARPQRSKLVQFFRPHTRDRGKGLRVSRYLAADPQVRFSIWDDHGVAEAAVSLDNAEADRLAEFLAGGCGEGEPATARWLDRFLASHGRR
jgi:hypothetical protein